MFMLLESFSIEEIRDNYLTTSLRCFCLNLFPELRTMSEMQQMPPPPGGDRSRGPDVYGAVIPITVLSTAFVLARMFARIKLIKNVGWDDHTIVLAQVILRS